MKRIVLALMMIGVLGASVAPEAQAYGRRPILRQGLRTAARIGIGVGLGRGYGYGYPGYGYGGYGYGGYGYRSGFGMGFY